MNTPPPLFTVLTPTYNREALLSRLHESLRRQSFVDFEWLIIDDGSTDGTRELVEQWVNQATFSIRYLHQANGGKQSGFNRGVKNALGTLIAQIDSDDELLPDALQKLAEAWHAVPGSERSRFVGVTGLCQREDGQIVGDRYPTSPLISNNLESRYRHRIRGEKWGFQRRDVLMKFPFPESTETTHVPESNVWGQIARHYQTVYINEVLRVYHSSEGADQLTKRSPAEASKAMLLQHSHALNEELDFFRSSPLSFIRSAIHYTRSSLHQERSLAMQCRGLRPFARVLWGLGLPAGWYVYRRDKRQLRNRGP